MQKILFISVQTLKDKSVIMDNTDEKTLTLAIQEYQELEIEAILSTSEYARLTEQLIQVQTGVITELTPADQVLMQHIVPCLVYGAAMYSIRPLHYKLGNKGSQVDRDTNAELGNTEAARADFAFKADGYKRKLIEYIHTESKSVTTGCQSIEDTTFNFTGMSLPDYDSNYEEQYRSDYYKDARGRRII